MQVTFKDNTVVCYIDDRIFSKEVVQKCFYWYTADYSLSFEMKSDHILQVILKSKSDLPLDQGSFIEKLSQDLNDFQLRTIVLNETATIRELIVAKAFANFDDEPMESNYNISDPVGFSPELK